MKRFESAAQEHEALTAMHEAREREFKSREINAGLKDDAILYRERPSRRERIRATHQSLCQHGNFQWNHYAERICGKCGKFC